MMPLLLAYGFLVDSNFKNMSLVVVQFVFAPDQLVFQFDQPHVFRIISGNSLPVMPEVFSRASSSLTPGFPPARE
jgi:hypothetical protein